MNFYITHRPQSVAALTSMAQKGSGCQFNKPGTGICLCCSFVPTTYFHDTGQDFDMTEFEVLGLDLHLETKELLSKTPSESQTETESESTTLTPQFSLSSTPSPPATPPPQEEPEEVGKGEQATSSSQQLRLIKRKAPEVYHLVNMAAQLLPDSNCPLRVAIYSLIH